MRLHNLKAPEGSRRSRKRVGRGESSGVGKTSGRGTKGQGARTGKGKPRRGFEGGQTPMYRRMPKRGFTNVFAKTWGEVNVDVLNQFAAGSVVDCTSLAAAGLVKKRSDGVRVLGRGDIDRALTIRAHHVTASARKKIEAAGGTVEVLSEKAA